MLIHPETFVCLFVLVAISGQMFTSGVAGSCAVYIIGVMVATELSKMWGLM